MSDNPDLISVEEAQQLLRVSRATLFNLARRHALARYQSPSDHRRVYFDRAAVEQLLHPQPKEPADDAQQ